MTRARVLAALLVVAICAVARPARADGTPEARRHFDQAEVAYRAGRYADALTEYQAGYAAKPLPGFLVNIAQCQRRLGDLKTARATYHEFILVAPDSRLVPEVKTLIRQLDAVIAELAAGQDPSPAEVAAGPDIHTSELVTAPVLAATPPQAPANPALIATPAEAPESAPPARRSHARWWIWGGVAAAAIAGGVVAAVAMSSPGTTAIHAGSLGTLSR